MRKLPVIPTMPALVGAGGLCAGAGLLSWAAVAPSAQVFGRTLRNTGDPSTIALTFDDGPNPSVTPALLDLLDAHNASATFFQIGIHIRRFPALVNEVLRRGHTIGNHTDTHPRLTFLPSDQIQHELAACADAFQSATGATIRWMRPPFGYRGPQLTRALRQHNPSVRVVMWSVSGRDWRPQPAERIMNRLQRVKGGDIVLLHDGDHRSLEGNRSQTVTALEYWLPRWNKAGYKLLSLDKLLERES
jgi:peptidoglycan/xylan/chitin deacetylase (PgdA/CDA1 family)